MKSNFCKSQKFPFPIEVLLKDTSHKNDKESFVISSVVFQVIITTRKKCARSRQTDEIHNVACIEKKPQLQKCAKASVNDLHICSYFLKDGKPAVLMGDIQFQLNRRQAIDRRHSAKTPF